MTKDFEKLRARHRLKFIAGAQSRITRGLELIGVQTADSAERLYDELHTLAGEASILGLDTMAAVARAGADAARLWHEQASTAAARVCEHSLQTLRDTIELLAEMNTGDFTKQAESVLAAGNAPRRADTPEIS